MEIINLVLVIVFGLPSWIILFWHRRPARVKLRYNDVDEGVIKIARSIISQIQPSMFNPEFIIGISTAGSIISARLSAKMQELTGQWRQPISLSVSQSWENRGIVRPKVDDKELEHHKYIAGKKVLLLDAVSITGFTLDRIRQDLERLNPKPIIKIAVLVRPKDFELEAQEPKTKPEFYDFCARQYKLNGSAKNVELPYPFF